MLADGVRELDELGLWASWSSSGAARGAVGMEMGRLGFGRKVYYMGRSRRDRGVVPLLESVGVRLSSAKLIAPYVAAAGLPVLIQRVKVLKEMLFSSGDDAKLIGRNAKRMMANLSIPADDALQSTLSLFEKMEARHGGVSLLGHGDISFPYLIESFPMLLLCSEDNHLKPLTDFLESIGIPKLRIASILLLFPPIILSDVESDIKPRIHEWEKAGIEQEYIATMLLKYPWILSTTVKENYKQMVLFFNRRKISRTVLNVAVKSWPRVLGCSIKRMNTILELFDDLGISKKMVVLVITSSPQLMLRKPNEFLQVYNDSYSQLHSYAIWLNYLLEAGLFQKDVCSMIFRFSPLLGYSINLVMKPKLEFLLRTMKKPLKSIVEYPRYFSYSLEGKIKPRFFVLQNRNIDCSLTEIFAKNDELFAIEYLGIEGLLEKPLQSSKGG
ncbi:hypothetical protein PR202_gb23304 [Eleusine coracana subsp. coracana]|uniref:Uncharacterized protein n=1 Tax=Eleusine coracana subsp. coracana TaxID=191504 RepID=A0AAV5FII0_ELECO|nr:hypothetical protein PR202_gb23304 [Eleusine coracana subsp. coracana]